MFIIPESQKKLFYSFGFMVCWATCFVTAMTLVKKVSPELSTNMVIFLRMTFGLIFIMPVVLRKGLTPLKTQRLPLHIARCFFTCLAIAATYNSYRYLSLSTATTIGFTSPLIVSFLSWLIFKDHMSYLKIFFILLGYCGVLVIAGDDYCGDRFYIYVAIAGNIVTSFSILIMKSLTKTESTESIMLYTNLFTFGVWGIIIAINPSSIQTQDALYLCGVGVFGVCSQFFYMKALQWGDASYVSPFEYLRLVVATIVGVFILKESITNTTLMGGGIIILGSMGLMFVEKRKKLIKN